MPQNILTAQSKLVALLYFSLWPLPSQSSSWQCSGEETSVFPRFPFLLCVLAVWAAAAEGQRCLGNSRAPEGAPNPRMSFLLQHPSGAWHSFLHPAWILCLGLVPAACHARCVQLQDQNISTAIYAGRSVPCTGQSLELGSPLFVLDVCTSLKRGLLPNWLSLAGL